MARFRTSRERRLWLLAAILVLFVYGSAYFVQFLLDALRARGALEATIWGAFGLAAAAGLGAVAHARPGRWEIALLAAAAGVYLLWLRQLHIIQERIHLIQYGALGGLAYAALRERWSAPVRRWQHWPAACAVLIAGAAGWGDEIVQGILPNRVYDLRDVATNAKAAALFVLVVAARQRLRAERARRDSAHVAASPAPAAPESSAPAIE